MNYEFFCVKCKKQHFIACRISEYDKTKMHTLCCGMVMEPVIWGGVLAFQKEGFPKGTAITEHCTEEPVFCKDKAQLRDLCEESNCVSRYIEDDM